MFNKKEKKDEDIIIYDENDSIQRSRQKSRRIFVFYIIALFCVALVIILVSYVVQAHQQQQLNDMGERLDEQTDAAQGATSRAEKMAEQLESLQEQVNSLQKKLDEANGDLDEKNDKNQQLQKQLDKAQAEADALESLWQLEKAYNEGDTDTALSIIEALDSKYGHNKLISVNQQPLTDDAAKEYNNICTELGAE